MFPIHFGKPSPVVRLSTSSLRIIGPNVNEATSFGGGHLVDYIADLSGGLEPRRIRSMSGPVDLSRPNGSSVRHNSSRNDKDNKQVG